MEAILEFLKQNIGQISAVILGLGVVSMYAGFLRGVLVQAAELLIAIDAVLADGKVTQEEIEKIKKEAIDVWLEIKKFKK